MKGIKVFSLLAMTLIPAVLYAGVHSTVEVTITLDANGAASSAQGSVADAHNSVDANQYIGCGSTMTTTGASFAFCQAHDATADADGLVNAAFCTTTNALLVAQIQSIGSDSFVRFTINADTGECATVRVSHQSLYRPKAH